ncbi:MAG: hypothetical protein ACYCSN_13570 [Acidobacteriaceae bacterium]
MPFHPTPLMPAPKASTQTPAKGTSQQLNLNFNPASNLTLPFIFDAAENGFPSGIHTIEVDNQSSLVLTVTADGRPIRTVGNYSQRFLLNLTKQGGWSRIEITGTGTSVSGDTIALTFLDEAVYPPFVDAPANVVAAGAKALGSFAIKGPFPVIDVDTYSLPPPAQWGVADETAAIQAALNAASAASYKAVVRFSSRPYKVKSLTWPATVPIVGVGSDLESGQYGTRILGTSGYDTLVIADVPNGGRSSLRGVYIDGGDNAIACYTTNYVTHVLIKESVLAAGSGYSCVAVAPGLGVENVSAPGIERWTLRDVTFTGGDYGFSYIGQTPGSVPNDMDRMVFDRIVSGGLAKSHFNFQAFAGYNATFIQPNLLSCGEHAFIVNAQNGGAQGWMVISPNTEAIGQSIPYTVTNTTGSITAGSSTLTVASAGSMASGQSILVVGAGQYGGDLLTTISAVAGTTITLAAAAQTTVTTALVNTGMYDEFYLQSITGITFIAPNIGTSYYGGRYSINGLPNEGVIIGGSLGVLPAYVTGQSPVILGANGTISMEHDQANDHLGQTILTEFAPHNNVPSTPGGNLQFGLVDSNFSGAGTLGSFLWRVSNPNRRVVAQMDQYGSFQPLTIAPKNGVQVIASGTTTPTTQNVGWVLKTANTVATTITNFLDGYSGQELKLIFGDALTTIANNATISLAGGANFTGAVGNMIAFLFDGAVWQEQYRRTM